MTAKEMFNVLGYEKYETSLGELAYINQELYYQVDIIFTLSGNQVKVYQNILENNEVILVEANLNVKEIKAITQQMKELGWLE